VVSLIKNGTGTLTLSAAGDYTGATTVNAGIVDVKNNTALGTSAGATTVAANAAVQIDGSGLSIAEPFTLTGTGVSTAGVIRNLANNNTLSGLITLSTSAVRINSDSGTLTLDVSSGNAITASNINVTFGGSGNITVADPIATGSGTLTERWFRYVNLKWCEYLLRWDCHLFGYIEGRQCNWSAGSKCGCGIYHLRRCPRF
jgi:autotransporter-associated beta strand protein